jgi:aconitate hydratase
MSPEFGSTAAIFPIDDVTLRLPAPDRPQPRAGGPGRGVREGAATSGTTRHEPVVQRVPRARPVDRGASIAGPKRPQDRILLERTAALRAGPAQATPTPSTTSSTWRSPSRSRHPTRRELAGGRAHAAPPLAHRSAGHGLQAHPGDGRRRQSTRSTTGRHDRGDHLVHEHLEPVGDAGGGAAGPQGGAQRA